MGVYVKILSYIYIFFFAQSKDEAVHLPQQHDELRHRVGIEDQPGAAPRPCGACQAGILLPSRQSEQI